MKCPICEESSKKSVVYGGTSCQTAAYYRPYYDEDGVYHNHDFNLVSSEYDCSEGHHFSTRSKRGCSLCGIEPYLEIILPK